ncbi:NUDIX domain-containing protein [Chryseobacterium taklimakanense]|uniref:NUDIX domain-containing protein n=1 Tax=Chryseobacterium taklimakanense TaxID=536441 RepID=UPI000F5F7A49|nr:NUDIX domain-containing protein [Chryseobacterium taklimakanense]AZI22783.1 NUDIX domain-containing protein [Chryseobacterium taklimakanense]
MINSFNIRVYAACIKDKKIFTLFEEYVGEKLIKLPGGGLEFGEGTVECLKREFAEELNLEIENIQHLYTQEDFIISKFKQNQQLLTIYYTADIKDESALKIMDSTIENTEWISLAEENPFNLPVDRIVFEKLKATYL